MDSPANLKTTPLKDEHMRLGAKMAPFGGWLMPIQYSGIIAEHQWTRKEAAVFDICHMGEFLIRGDADKSGLNRIVTFDLKSMVVGSCRYGFMLNESGGIIDDLIVYRVAPEEWMLVVNAATTEGDAAHIRRGLSSQAEFKNISDATGKLDLQGPRSQDVLKKLAGDEITRLGYYTFGCFELLGEHVIISRTGYTGELGYEIYISSSKARELWKILLADARVKPAGLGARDTLRLEMCYPLYGQDIDTNTTPIEAGMKSFVDMDKEFAGKRPLSEGAALRRLVYFKAQTRRSPRHNYRIHVNGADAGVVTSGSFSPSLGCGIGMGYVYVSAPAGTQVILKDNEIEIPAVVTERPFYKAGTARR